MPVNTDPSRADQVEQREAFRINDTLPIAVHKIEGEEGSSGPERDLNLPFENPTSDLEKENISPQLWKMLVHINQKLDRILERIPVDLLSAPAQPVNLSSSGIKVKVKKSFGLDEPVRIKMLLPTLPVKELLISGRVMRIKALPEGEYEVALHFQDLDDTVKNEIIRYTLNQQRKTIAAQKQKRGQDESVKEKGL
jgi:hypothetical protein